MYDIYFNDNNDSWRYTLGLSGATPLITIGLNPSTATKESSDPTVARVERVAQQEGFDGFVMLNLYPVRATDYRTLPVARDQLAYTRNIAAIEKVVSGQPKPTIWAAWGASVAHHEFFLDARDELFARLEKYKPQWLKFGDLTTDGHPRHPSRLSYKWKFSPYRYSL